MIFVVLVIVSSFFFAQSNACSFLVSNFDLFSYGINLTHVNYHMRFRGPDATNVIRHSSGWTFVHNLLSMTGSNWTLQPFVSDDKSIVALFNGEVYNYRNLAMRKKSEGGLGMDVDDSQSDGIILVPSYRNWGTNFVKYFRGEFAIVLVDFAKQLVLLSTDVFSTKPLWYGTFPCSHVGTSNASKSDGVTTCFAAASYESALSRMEVPKRFRIMAEPNEVLALNLSNNFVVVSRKEVFKFDLQQYKTSTEDWQRAFVDAVRIRTDFIKHEVFVGMSAGYDSGAIMLALEALKKPFLAYHVNTKKDSLEIIRKRSAYCTQAQSTIIKLDNESYEDQRRWLVSRIEPYHYVGVGKGRLVVDDKASVGLSCILSRVTKQGGYIYLSGSGADETISDYAIQGKKVFGHSCFSGRFPPNLTDIFPWCSFYKGTQRAYLMKEELTGGAHGIESRYPFLDPLVVQEYLWLTSEIKNSEYKRPIADFLRRHEFPNQFGEKAGFGVVHNRTTLKQKIYRSNGNNVTTQHPTNFVDETETALPDVNFNRVALSTFLMFAAWGLIPKRYRRRSVFSAIC